MGHLNSHLLWHKYAEPFFAEGKKILEIGPAGYPTHYEKYLKQKGISNTYQVLDVGTDYISGAEANPDFILSADPMHYPIADNEFDVVFSDQVLECVSCFWVWYEELKRITKPGGHIITISAYSYPRCPSPIDNWRIYADGMIELNKQCGLETVLCFTESLEMEKYNIPKKTGYYFPGASITNPHGGTSDKNLKLNLLKNSWNKVVGNIPKIRSLLLNPVQVSFDTITIAQKPLS